MTIVGGVAWTDDFLVLDSAIPAVTALRTLEASSAGWIVIRRVAYGGTYLYALRPKELLVWLNRRLAERGFGQVTPRPRFKLAPDSIRWRDLAFEEVLDLHEEQASTQTDYRNTSLVIDRSWRLGIDAPSIERYVEVGGNQEALAVGTAAPTGPARRRRTRGGNAAPKAPPTSARPAPDATVETPPPETAAPAPTAEVPFDDEGTAPTRHPSIEADVPPAPGAALILTVDLLRRAVEHTQGGPVTVGPLATDWRTLDLDVIVTCPAIELGNAGRGVVTIRRNADSEPVRFEGHVRADTPADATITVVATFFHGTRFCGSAVRLFRLGAPDGATAGVPQTTGAVAAEPSAQRPDVTVYISQLDPSTPGRLHWQVVTHRFDGLPPSLDADINLGTDPAAEAGALFAQFAVLEPGQHREQIEGFGSRLWKRAPPMFRVVYWVLWDHYKRPLTIQFISDEPHLPWELMRPVREDESEIHPPLALRHVVARWIKRWDGYMRNQLPGGRIYTIAPKYASASRRLPRAESEAEKLVAEFGAQRKAGTRQAVLELLQTAPPAEPVGILHFAGHGKFAPQVATESNIKLEDGGLAAAEVERPEVRLGRACRTLVFFNACEIGAAGAVFGEVGGWADAFLSRQFGGFIAPLWSVEDDDAGTVAAELLDGIFKRRLPIGSVLRGIRAKYGDVSPTFFSYLYYGDVTARFGGT